MSEQVVSSDVSIYEVFDGDELLARFRGEMAAFDATRFFASREDWQRGGQIRWCKLSKADADALPLTAPNERK